MVYFPYFGTKCIISVPDWTNYLGLSFCFYHHQISFKTIDCGEGDVVILYKVTVCFNSVCFRKLPVVSSW